MGGTRGYGESRDSSTYLDRSEEWSGDDVDAPSAAAARPIRAPRDGRTPRRVRGVARAVNFRYDHHRERTMLTFRVDRYDDEGNRLRPVAVEMRYHRQGQVAEGDEVEVVGCPSRGLLRARRVVNHTTGGEVRGGIPAALKVAGALFLVAVVVGGVVGGRWLLSQHEDQNFPGAPGLPGFGGTQSGSVTVPAVSGTSVSQAQQQLVFAGLQPTNRYERSTTAPAGTVIRSEPPPGTAMDVGGTVTLVVSTGRS